MLRTYTAKYVRIPSGYMGQLVDWPEVITEGAFIGGLQELPAGRPQGDDCSLPSTKKRTFLWEVHSSNSYPSRSEMSVKRVDLVKGIEDLVIRVLGLDIGGANLKMAHSDGMATAVPFELWKYPEKLAAVLTELVAGRADIR